jgi:TRAP-type C4-dicarboxylate transport system permease large subunit
VWAFIPFYVPLLVALLLLTYLPALSLWLPRLLGGAE